MIGGLRQIANTPSVVSGSLQNLYLGVWRRATPKSAVDILYDGVRRLIHDWPGGVGMMLYVEKGTALPLPEIRDYMLEQRRSVAPHLIAASLTVPGEGLWSATVRTIAVTLGLSSGTIYPSKSFAALEEAAAWQVARMGPDFSVPAEALVRALQTMRANEGSHPQVSGS
ncbi:MAG: hypothetical protein R3B09_23360 [Nannocystaceae bacterium]